jgi:hypothetical protein
MLRELRLVGLSLKEPKLDCEEGEEWKLGEWERQVSDVWWWDKRESGAW